MQWRYNEAIYTQEHFELKCSILTGEKLHKLNIQIQKP